MSSRKYQFSWDLIGDLNSGRPNLGPYARLEMYRLMQYTFRDVLEQCLDSEKADEIFYQAGKLAGKEMFSKFLANSKDLHGFVKNLQNLLKDMRVGVLRVEKADLDQGELVLTISEDLDCSGLPEINYEICKYDEGFIAGLLENFTGSPFQVKEIDCWCTGDRTCRFTAARLD
jgi:predicted hydrocarbon binding protein